MNCEQLAQLASLYLSGELDPARSATLRAHLQGCAACATEIEQQRDLDARLRAGVVADDLDYTPLERRVRRRIAADSAARTRFVLAAAGVAAVLLAAGLASRITPRLARVYQDAALDHRREIVDGQPRPWLTDPAAIESLAASQGLPSASFLALARTGYRLEKGKICRLDGRLFLHLVYTDGAQEFSVYLREGERPAGSPEETVNGRPLFTADSGPDHMAAFQKGGLAVLFVDSHSRARARNLARSAAAAL